MSGFIGGAGSKSGVIGTTELDYETGDWTPVEATGLGLDVQSGTYTRIGNKCFINCKVRASGVGTADNFIGLPFTSYSSAETTGAAISNELDWAAGTSLSAFIEASNERFKIYISGDNIAWSTTTTWAASDIAICTFNYTIA